MDVEGVAATVYRQLRRDKLTTVDAGVPEEAPLTIFVNGFELATLMCTPHQQQALALGFLANEGLIAGIEEVRVSHLCGTGTCVDVWLSHAIRRPTRSIITSGCGGGLTFDDLSRQIDPLNSDLRVTATQIHALMRQLNVAGKIYPAVRGVHTSALAEGETLLLTAEDVGRHNTLDKLSGLALMQGISTHDRILLSSGRVSSEMLNKAARMGAPVVVSRTSPTSLSVSLARAWGITLVGYARHSTMNVYAGIERLEIDPRVHAATRMGSEMELREDAEA
jgi:FdhD protein